MGRLTTIKKTSHHCDVSMEHNACPLASGALSSIPMPAEQCTRPGFKELTCPPDSPEKPCARSHVMRLDMMCSSFPACVGTAPWSSGAPATGIPTVDSRNTSAMTAALARAAAEAFMVTLSCGRLRSTLASENLPSLRRWRMQIGMRMLAFHCAALGHRRHSSLASGCRC